MEEQVFIEMLKKLGIAKNDRIISKAKEFYDLLAIKSGGIAAKLNDSAKTILCLDLSCEALNISFDSVSAISLTAMKKSAYENNRKLLSKQLNLNKKLDINGLILKMGISSPNLDKSAKLIYDTYQKSSPHIDLDHPQYVSMSLYQACKLEKVKVSKKNFVLSSNLKPNQWTQLEKSWDKWVVSIGPIDKENKDSKSKDKEDVQRETTINGQKLKRKYEDEIEDYDVWAKRTLDKARAELKGIK